MKNTIKTISTLLITSALIISCKKKKDETPQPVPTYYLKPIPKFINKLTAKVNNTDWSMASREYGEAYSLSKYGTSWSFGGQNSFTNPFSQIRFSFTYTVGIVNLTKWGNYSLEYRDENGINYSGVTGTLNISLLDTSHVKSPYIDQVKATFSFKTDTVNGKSFNVTEGIIDFIK